LLYFQLKFNERATRKKCSEKEQDVAKQKKQDSAQIEFATEQLDMESPFRKKRFSVQRMIEAKFTYLSANIERLTHSEIVWLSRIEEFFIQYCYLTERQTQVLQQVVERLQPASRVS
jgi:hypothetical protein